MIPDAEAPGDGVLDIEGPIAEEQWFGDETSSKEFKKALAGLKNVTVHINSPGGDVMAGAEIYSALMEHRLNGKGKVTVIITALAASAASVVAMAGDEILISPVAYMMIHNPWTVTAGDAKEMRKAAKTLDEIAEGLITAYQRKTGKTRDQLKKMLENETWMSAQTCVEEGFADGIYGGEISAAAFLPAHTMTRQTPAAIAEMCARWEKAHAEADPEEEPEEEPEEPGTEPEDPEEDPEKEDRTGKPAKKAADPEKDPDEDPDEEPGSDPEEDPDGEPGADPEEEPGADPEDPEEKPEEEPDEEKEKENLKRAEIARRMEILSRTEW